MSKIILAIESSCDETACSIVKNGNEILSNVVSSQIATHSKFGGVVPEVASRLHVENISLVISDAINNANVTWDEIDAIAVTKGPGLIGSLHVGMQAAKTLSWMYNKPLIPVHHIAGHIFANCFVSDLQYPLMSLVVSGGHTQLVYMSDETSFEIIGETLDDAIGEAYDKVARVLGLPYPGGPEIDKLSKVGRATYKLPKPKTERLFDFSFSGLKSAVLQLIQREKKYDRPLIVEDVAASFQKVAVEILIDKVELALNKYQPKQLILAGGVAANSHLRSEIKEKIKEYEDIELIIPPLWCCTDNAAMIAAAASISFKNKKFEDLGCTADSSLEIL
ncbi:MAG: tRNA (adenosine(37)-N6)-threonylcarbamoyltransferase complex transferase subunit TsaD [Anaerorhabdus sp.]